MVVVVRAAEGIVSHVADVGIVDAEMVLGTVIGQLYEGTEAIGNLAGVEETRLLREQNVSIFGQRPCHGAVR